MKRRNFVYLATVAAFMHSFNARARSSTQPTIGFLGATSPTAWAPMLEAFEHRLRELGWSEGRNVKIERRWAEGRPDRFAALAQEFVSIDVDVIVTVGSAVAATKNATSSIPIIFALAIDPVGSGFVESLSHPGGNVTGLSSQAVDTAGKRIELLRQVIPGLSRIAVLANALYPATVRESADVEAAARALAVPCDPVAIRSASEIEPAIRALKGRVRALYLCSDSLVITNVHEINYLARQTGIATMWSAREFCEAGGLISYGANEVDLFRRAADYVDKILRGAKPADIPVEQPTAIELAINLDTARVLGLNIPQNLLALANTVIEK